MLNIKLKGTPSPILPLCIGDDYVAPSPQSVLLIALSKYRESDLSDKELASFLCNNLYSFMSVNQLKICCIESPDTDELLIFEKDK